LGLLRALTPALSQRERESFGVAGRVGVDLGGHTAVSGCAVVLFVGWVELAKPIGPW